MNSRFHKPKKHPRRGATLILAVFFIIVMLAMVGFAVDLGYVVLVRTQLQVAADSAAIAATAVDIDSSFEEVLATAVQYAGYHGAGGKNIELNPADVQRGVWDSNHRRFTPSGSRSNAVRVITRRDSTANGESSLFFAKALGINSCALKTEAVAAYVDNFVGFRPPSSGENLPLLPFAIDKGTWDALLAGNGTDDWTWDPQSGEITAGPDGIPEANCYPQDTGAPGNRGTVDIGSSSNSTADLSRQILDGVSPEDLSYHGGKLELDQNGELQLNGDPGISTGIKHALKAIEGEARIVALFSDVVNPGDNATYTIVGYAGVRIVEMGLGEGDKRLMVQPANLVVRGGIPASGPTPTSYFIFSPVYLVR